MRRADLLGTTHFRSARVFCAGSAWFFQTREGIDVGPYATRDTAVVEAQRLAQVHRRAQSRRER
jgi:uncharacterized protein DUF6316